jgi:hypothetical protein
MTQRKPQLTTYEASIKYDISTRHLRHLLEEKKLLEGQRHKISATKEIWILEESSIIHYLKNRPKPGPRPKT